MNSVGPTDLTSVTSGAAVDTLGEDTGGGGGTGDTVATQITGTSDDDDDDVPSSPGSFGEDEGSMPGEDDVTAQLAAAGGWSGERDTVILLWWREPRSPPAWGHCAGDLWGGGRSSGSRHYVILLVHAHCSVSVSLTS